VVESELILSDFELELLMKRLWVVVGAGWVRQAHLSLGREAGRLQQVQEMSWMGSPSSVSPKTRKLLRRWPFN